MVTFQKPNFLLYTVFVWNEFPFLILSIDNNRTFWLGYIMVIAQVKSLQIAIF